MIHEKPLFPNFTFDFESFCTQYFETFMSFGPELIAAFDKHFTPCEEFLQAASPGWSGPHFTASFCVKKGMIS